MPFRMCCALKASRWAALCHTTAHVAIVTSLALLRLQVRLGTVLDQQLCGTLHACLLQLGSCDMDMKRQSLALHACMHPYRLHASIWMETESFS